MMKKLLIGGVVFSCTGVMLGALGAHALKEQLDASQLASFETGVRYQLFHGLALMVVALIPVLSNSVKNLVFWFFVVGLVLFSGSIYGLSTQAITGTKLSFLGPVTPVGGLLLILGWLFVLFKLFQFKTTKD
jgi:uncharacterized membrane protein YgdD (TMEM256/DUF423 family)